MSRGELQANFTTSRGAGTFQTGGVYSSTNARVWTGTDKRVSITARNEDVLKTWYQGNKYMHYGAQESEFIVIGRPLRSEAMTKIGSDSWEHAVK